MKVVASVMGMNRFFGTRVQRAATAVAVLVALGAVLGIVGCGSSGHGVVPVAGVVTLDGEAVEGVRVTFQPKQIPGVASVGPGSVGTSDASGRVSVKTVAETRQEGAVVGDHKVVFATSSELTNEDGSYTYTEERIPERYWTDGITVTVPEGGKTDFTWELTTTE